LRLRLCLPAQVLAFYSYGDVSKSEQIAEEAMTLQDTFDNAIKTVKEFNKRCVRCRGSPCVAPRHLIGVGVFALRCTGR
jgi:hypothetical protein